MNSSRAAAAAVLALALLATGCGGGSDTNASDRASATPSAIATRTGTAAGKPGGAAPTASRGGAVVKPSATSEAATGSGGAATTGGSTGGSSGTAAATSTRPGTYSYDIKGKASASNGQSRDINSPATLVVDKAVGDRQHSALTSEETSTEQDFVHSESGVLLAYLKVSSQVGDTEFRPAKPVLAVPNPASAGRSWSWSMTSTDGKTKADYTAKITGTEKVTIGGVTIDTVVIESTLKLTGQGYTLTQQSRENYDVSRLLRVKETSHSSAVLGAFGGSADTTQLLRSLTPH